MTDFMSLLETLRRPKLLIRAARFGMQDYNRERDLRRLIKVTRTPSPSEALTVLITEEGNLEENRQAGDARYSITRHIEILSAMIAEARLLPRLVKP